MPGLPVNPARARAALAGGLVLLALAGCARQASDAVAPDAPGFLAGVWHGFIFPFAWIASLFMSDVAVYAVPNNGGWYDFGYFVGIVVLGGGSWFSGSKAKRRTRREA